MKDVTCPSCKSSRVGVAYRVPAVREVSSFDDDGTPEYEDEGGWQVASDDVEQQVDEDTWRVFTEDAQQQIDAKTGRLILVCLTCGAHYTVEGI